MSSYKDNASDEAIPIMAMIVAGIIGFILGIYSVNLQWKFMDLSMPLNLLLVVSFIGLIFGTIAIAKGHFLYGAMPLTASILSLSLSLFMIYPTTLFTGIQMFVIIAVMMAIIAAMCFIGGEFNTLVACVCFAVAAVLMIDEIEFEYKGGITGIFFIIAGATAVYSAVLNWNAVAGRERSPSRRRSRRDDYYDDDDIDGEDRDASDLDEYDEYDSPRRRRD